MIKRLFDILFAITILVIGSPLLVVIAILIKLDSKGPILFIQERLGQNGTVFSMLKFRTMVENAEQMGTGLFSFSDDKRITRVGRILRLLSLDELPQLGNVLVGSMSIVGPRPPVTYELGEYSDLSDWQKKRFTAKPGLTGLAQVSGRNSLNWEQKMKYDNQYVEQFKRWGVLCDAVVLLRTVWVVVTLQSIIEPHSDAVLESVPLAEGISQAAKATTESATENRAA